MTAASLFSGFSLAGGEGSVGARSLLRSTGKGAAAPPLGGGRGEGWGFQEGFYGQDAFVGIRALFYCLSSPEGVSSPAAGRGTECGHCYFLHTQWYFTSTRG